MSPESGITNFEALLADVPQERVEEAYDYWNSRTLDDVANEMPNLKSRGFADVAVVEPDTSDVDETRTLVLPLEFTQGYTEPHYMRAKVLQQYVAPESRVVILPNTTFGRTHVDIENGLNKTQKVALKIGDNRPYGQLLMNALEKESMVSNLGTLDITGSSQGATSALSMAAAGSDMLKVQHVTAIETPSKRGRHSIGLLKDFVASGGDLKASVRESEIPAQLEAMSGPRFAIDLGKFATRPFVGESRLIARSLTGTVEDVVRSAYSEYPDLDISIYRMEDSTVYDPESLPDDLSEKIRNVELVGEHVHGHSTPNNLRFNAAISHDGFRV